MMALRGREKGKNDNEVTVKILSSIVMVDHKEDEEKEMWEFQRMAIGTKK